MLRPPFFYQIITMKYIIIGGVAGGATTAARLRRMDEDASIIVFEKGKHISYANCGLPYYIGGVIAERNALFLQTPTTLGDRFDADVRTRTEVLSIDRTNKTIRCRHLDRDKEYEEKYDKLVLSPGSIALRPSIPGADLPGIFLLKDVFDTDAIKEYLQQIPATAPRRAVIVGAGFIGLEMAENLHHLGFQVSVVEKAPHILPVAEPEVVAQVQAHLRSKGVQLLLNESVSEFRQKNQTIEVSLANGQTIDADFVLLSVGVRPNIELARNAGLQIGSRGGIVVNDFMQTSDPDIYAIGDAVETISPLTGKPQLSLLAGPTNKQARICANNIALGNQQHYHGSIGTAIAKVFDMAVGCTGFSESTLQQEGIPYIASITHTASHATYYPENFPITIKMMFSPDNGRLLGASVSGRDGVDKRLDLIASVIAHQGTIYELTDFDHAYAPPFSSAKDAVNQAGYVAENILAERVHPIQWHQLRDMLANRSNQPFTLIDVRSFLDTKAGSIDGALNYPLEELREFIDDEDPELPVVLYCTIGLRGYIAARILQQSGFQKVYNLSGGYLTYSLMTAEAE